MNFSKNLKKLLNIIAQIDILLFRHYFVHFWRLYMKVQYISSACVLLEHQGIRILCDPWLTDGIYYGSWFHYPPLKYTPEDFGDVDYIYISHIHPDHMDMETLRRLPRSIPILIHDYAEKFVLRNLENLGFENLREVQHKEVVNLSDTFTLEILAADNCDPSICGKFMGCSVITPYNKTIQIDTLAVFHANGKTVVNTNDCPFELSYSVCDYIKSKYNTIDFLLVGYAGAGPFPQCFEMDENNKVTKALEKKQQFLNQTLLFLNRLQPLSFMPFAGQYHLGGRLAKLNEYRGVPEIEDLPEIFASLLHKNQIKTECILLNSGEWLDIEKGLVSNPFIPPSKEERDTYIQEVLSLKKYVYEIHKYDYENPEQVLIKLSEAHQRMKRYQDKDNYWSEWCIYLDIGHPVLYKIPFNGDAVSIVEPGMEIQPFVRISLNYDLFMMILNRKAHWNNAEIGSHLHYKRQPDMFERGVYHFLSYLHV